MALLSRLFILVMIALAPSVVVLTLTLSANNGEDGVTIAIRERPDIIVCDIDMPKLDGYGVARIVKNDLTLAMVGDREKVLAAGFDGYIGKPIDPTTFVRDIETFLGYASGKG